MEVATPWCRSGLRPAPRFDGIERRDLSFQQHPAQHVLRRAVALFCGCAIEFSRALVILRAAPSPGNKALLCCAARPDRRPRPRASSHFAASAGSRSTPSPSAEAGADIVLRARSALVRQRSQIESAVS